MFRLFFEANESFKKMLFVINISKTTSKLMKEMTLRRNIISIFRPHNFPSGNSTRLIQEKAFPATRDFLLAWEKSSRGEGMANIIDRWIIPSDKHGKRLPRKSLITSNSFLLFITPLEVPGKLQPLMNYGNFDKAPSRKETSMSQSKQLLKSYQL